MRRAAPILPAAAALALAACNVETMPDAAEGAQLFADNCTACHGYRGEGAPELVGGDPAPDLRTIALRNDGVFPRAQVLSTIDGYGRGKAGDVMPEFGALLEGELVPVDIDGTLTPTPRPLAALMFYLESIQLE